MGPLRLAKVGGQVVLPCSTYFWKLYRSFRSSMLMAIFMVCSTPDKQNVKDEQANIYNDLAMFASGILVGDKLIRPFLVGESRSPRET